MTEKVKTLNQQIAELLGWTHVISEQHSRETYYNSGRHEWYEKIIGIQPKGTPNLLIDIPHYADSLDKIEKLLPKDAGFYFDQIGREYSVSIYVPYKDASDNYAFEGTAKTRTEAAAKALIAYLEWKAKQS